MTVQLLHIAAEETNKESNPLLLPGFTLAGVIVGIAGQWLVAHFNRKHERGLADLAARREAYARFRTALHMLADTRQKLDQSRMLQKVIDEGLKHDFVPGHSRQKYLDMQAQLLASYQASAATEDQALRDLYEAQTLVDILGTAPVRRAARTLRDIVSSNPPDDADADKWTAEAEDRFVKAVRREFGTKD